MFRNSFYQKCRIIYNTERVAENQPLVYLKNLKKGAKRFIEFGFFALGLTTYKRSIL